MCYIFVGCSDLRHTSTISVITQTHTHTRARSQLDRKIVHTSVSVINHSSLISNKPRLPHPPLLSPTLGSHSRCVHSKIYCRTHVCSRCAYVLMLHNAMAVIPFGTFAVRIWKINKLLNLLSVLLILPPLAQSDICIHSTPELLLRLRRQCRESMQTHAARREKSDVFHNMAGTCTAPFIIDDHHVADPFGSFFSSRLVSSRPLWMEHGSQATFVHFNGTFFPLLVVGYQNRCRSPASGLPKATSTNNNNFPKRRASHINCVKLHK